MIYLEKTIVSKRGESYGAEYYSTNDTSNFFKNPVIKLAEDIFKLNPTIASINEEKIDIEIE